MQSSCIEWDGDVEIWNIGLFANTENTLQSVRALSDPFDFVGKFIDAMTETNKMYRRQIEILIEYFEPLDIRFGTHSFIHSFATWINNQQKKDKERDWALNTQIRWDAFVARQFPRSRIDTHT